MSPWAANRLFATLPDNSGVRLRGADIENAQVQLLIRELAAANPENRAAQEMSALVKDGYRRMLAGELLTLVRQIGGAKGGSPGDEAAPRGAPEDTRRCTNPRAKQPAILGGFL